MKNIGIFCDGTWQHIGQPVDTNVAFLARAAEPRAVLPSGEAIDQFVYYDDGVGVGPGVLNNLVTLLGGVLGKGLDYKIMRAYEILALNYDPGDRIFIFGFSRGAYTARCLAGLIRWVGILKREHACEAEKAMARYRTRPPKPADSVGQQKEMEAFAASLSEFRAAYCHSEDPFTAPKPYDPQHPDVLGPSGGGAWIQYVGVWDTVGALGVPANLFLSPWLNAKYRFFDPSLSSFVRSARHAMSIDERRNTFPPTPWDNVDVLNGACAAQGLAYGLRPYQQQWFPGGHGAVGGGGDDGGISLPPLLWIAEGATRAGFALSEAKLEAWRVAANPLAPFQKPATTVQSAIIALDGFTDRPGPTHIDEVSASARERWKSAAPPYRPKPLSRHPEIVRDLGG